MRGILIARCGIVGTRYKPDAKATYHALPWWNARPGTAEALTQWDHLALHFPIGIDGDDGYSFTRALCGVELRHTLQTCWAEGTTVTCPRCAALVPSQGSPLPQSPPATAAQARP